MTFTHARRRRRPFYVIAFTDSNVFGVLPTGGAVVGQSQVRVDRDSVPEFKDEGNNTVVVPIDVTLAPAADLQVTSVSVPERVLRGQSLPVSLHRDERRRHRHARRQPHWFDRVYLSADPLFDTGCRPLPR